MRSVRGWITESVGGLPAAFWYLWTGTLVNRVGNFAILYLEMFLVGRYHVTASFAGLVIGLSGAGMAVGSVTGGVLADRFGRKPTMAWSSAMTVATTLALGLASAPWLIAALVAANGISNGLTRPAFSAMMVDVLGNRQRVRGFNLNYWAINIGFAGAATTAGLLSNAPRMTLFALDAATTAVSAILIFTQVKETNPGKSAVPSTAPSSRGGLRVVLGDGTFMRVVGLNLGMWTIISTISLLPITMLHHGLSPSAFGSVIALNGLIIVAGQLFVPRLIRSHARTNVLALAALLVGVGFGAVAFAPTVALLYGTVAIWTVGEMTASPSNSSLIADLSRDTLRGTYQGVASLSYSTAAFGSPIIGGYVIDTFGDRMLWIACLALGLVVAGGHLLAGPGRERQIAARKAENTQAAPAQDAAVAEVAVPVPAT